MSTAKTEEKKAPEQPNQKIIEAMSPEEVELNRQRFLSKMGFAENPDAEAEAEEKRKKKEEEAAAKKAEEKPAEEAKPETEKPEEKPAAEKPAEAKPKKRKAPTISTEEIVRRAAETATEVALETVEKKTAAAKADEPPAKPADAPAVAEMHPDDAERHRVLKFLETQGVKAMETVGKEFDVRYHDALLQVQRDDVPPHTIVEEVEKGYFLDDRVIRHAKVIVSTSSTGDSGEPVPASPAVSGKNQSEGN